MALSDTYLHVDLDQITEIAERIGDENPYAARIMHAAAAFARECRDVGPAYIYDDVHDMRFSHRLAFLSAMQAVRGTAFRAVDEALDHRWVGADDQELITETRRHMDGIELDKVASAMQENVNSHWRDGTFVWGRS